MMRKFLKRLYIIQEVSNKDRTPKLGKGYRTARRVNPYNPLSYIALILFFIVGVIAFGVVGLWREVELVNPFRWN